MLSYELERKTNKAAASVESSPPSGLVGGVWEKQSCINILEDRSKTSRYLNNTVPFPGCWLIFSQEKGNLAGMGIQKNYQKSGFPQNQQKITTALSKYWGFPEDRN